MENLIFEAQIFLDKSKICIVYSVGAVLFLIALGCIFLVMANWSDYSEVRYSLKYGTNVETGLAPTLYGWGWGFTIAIPIIYGLMWMSFDLKNPSLAINKDGIFLNRELFKKTFLPWAEFKRFEKDDNGGYLLYLNDPQKIVNQQPGWRKPFLKQTYVKEGAAIGIEKDERTAEIIQLLDKYCP